MSDALIDVVMTAYNAASTLRETIPSILRQSFTAFRLLIVDDGSTDETSEVIAKFADVDRRIKVIAKSNSGIVDSVNLGLTHVRAPLVARHDADDISYPRRFEEQVAYLQRHPDCVAVSGAARHVDAAGHPLGTHAIMRHPHTCDARAIPSREPYLMQPFLMARSQAIARVGGYRHVFYAEDTDLCWRLIEIGKLANLPFRLGDYRIHAKSISSCSILNGRIAAVSSQLAGLSHLRRKAGENDLVFRPHQLDAYVKARTSRAIVREAGRELHPDEQAYLSLAFCAKLMELSAYRPYRMEADDYAFIQETLARQATQAHKSHQKYVAWLRRRTEVQLVRRLQIGQFLAFTPPANVPGALARAVLKKPAWLHPKAPALPDQ